MEKSTAEAIGAFERAFPADARAVRRPMFGAPAGVVNRNLFAAVYGDGIVLRLPPDRLLALSELEGTGPFEPGGRRWKDYVLVDASRWSDTPELAGWVEEALEHTSTLPAKASPARGPGASER